MTYDRFSLAAAFVIFLDTFVATMLYVRRQGHDPKGGWREHGDGWRNINR
jgi:hypothetical protein